MQDLDYLHLNDFNADRVREIVKKIASVANIMIYDRSYGNEEYLHLSYDPLLHKIHVDRLGDGLLYPNHSMVTSLCPAEEFIKRIAPSAEFKEIFGE